MKVWVKGCQFVFALLAAGVIVSCVPRPAVREIIFDDTMTQLQVRSIQSRTFELTDRIKAMRAVIATLQDLDFVIDRADSRIGIITATKLRGYHLYITIKVDDRRSGPTLVRVFFFAKPTYPGMYGVVKMPEANYQEFFTSLSKNVFRLNQAARMGTLPPPPESSTQAESMNRPGEEKPTVAAAPVSVETTSRSLRRQPAEVISEKQLKAMLWRRGFFEKQLNPSGSFRCDLIDNQNGTITDQATGLMWQKRGSSSSLKYRQAQKYINNLNKEYFAGYADWRIPTMEELASLLMKDKANNLHIDSKFDSQQIRCWSSDREAKGQGHRDIITAWVVDYKSGQATKARWWDRINEPHGYGSTYVHFPDNYLRAVRSVKQRPAD